MPGEDVVYFNTSALAKWYLNESFSASILATADRIMAAGAHEMGLSLIRFFKSSRS